MRLLSFAVSGLSYEKFVPVYCFHRPVAPRGSHWTSYFGCIVRLSNGAYFAMSALACFAKPFDKTFGRRRIRFLLGELGDFRWLEPPLRTITFPRAVIFTRLAIALRVFIFGMMTTFAYISFPSMSPGVMHQG